MSTVMRRKRTSQRQLGPYKRHELLTGEVSHPMLGYTGYGDGHGTDLTAFISAEIKADWEANRDELLAFWKSGKSTIAFFADANRGYSPAAVRARCVGGGQAVRRTLVAQLH